MKLLIATLLASVVAAQEITLEEKWRILDTPTFEYDSLAFFMNFAVSEFIIPGQSRATLYTDGCKEEGTLLDGKSYLDFSDDSTNGIQTDVNGTRKDYADYCSTETCPIGETEEAAFYTRSAGLKFEIDPATIAGSEAGQGGEILATDADAEVNSNPVYTEETVGNVTAQVRFCVRYSLYTGGTGATVGNGDVEVNFLETIVTLDVDLSDGFTVDSIAVAPRDRLVRTAAQSYTCEGYFCDQDEVKLSAQALAATRNQGAAIRVCVIPQEDARNDGVYMRRIDSFTWTRTAPTTITQPAVESSAAAANGLTTLRCEAGDLICNFESILFASFYATAGAVNGGGICSMQFGGNGCELASTSGTDASAPIFGGIEAASCTDGTANDRRLRANRYLQNEDAATAEFDLALDLNQGSSTLGDNTPSSASTASMAMAVLAAGAALML
eukprot:CAMPEP_0113450954 /NCGR_PEP_ID=MMETSP0014_2-20120614/6094_1 /TAXON_ID=2857 /ORGANISM="Nitzschia sp." /LENGTH=441 /DNA_ID=CAMNT_0000342305 /DNA_START=129 /DNA_END=1454 /DNA_ORIENTATION=- /assembly_acc=CAM_ASM_000159